jgi:hypothetical protein
MNKKLSAISLAIVLLTIFCTGCPKNQSNSNNPPGGEVTLEERAVRAVVAIPGAVRILFPSASSTALGVIETAGTIFEEFLNDPTASKWDKAKDAWGKARLQLLNFNSTRLNQIVGAVDVLLSQVLVKATGTQAKSMPASVRVNFTEADVKKLEDLVKVPRE